MKLTDVHIDGFGVWSGLALEKLPPQGAVFYGPNEAGKTTLLQFIRAILYGFSPARRARYLPPLRGEQAGGTLGVDTPNDGKLSVCRRQSSRHSLGTIEIEAADGTVQGESHLRRLLHDVDEATFNNVFAIGLRELQELGTLNDTDAAQWLYALTAGLDRVSLHEVLRELETSRLRLMAEGDRPSAVRDLLAERDRLQGEVDELTGLSEQYYRLAGEREACQQHLAEMDALLADRAAEHRAIDAALRVFDVWQRRAKLDSQIEAVQARDRWPADALPRMRRLIAALKKRRRQVRALAQRRADLASQVNEIAVNKALGSQAARIEALGEHESWIVSAEQEIGQLEATVRQLCDAQQADGNRQRAAAGGTLAQPPDERTWAALRPAAAVVKRTGRRLNMARRKLAAAREKVESHGRRLESTGPSLSEGGLVAAIAAAGQRVTQLRRRLQLDERLEQLSQTQADLEQHVASLWQRQILPPWMLLALGAVFVLGVTLVLGGLFLPASFTGSLGWPMAWLGLLGMGSAVAAKYSMERSTAGQLDASQKQLALVESQSLEARTERESLDHTLPSAPGSLAQRLETAQRELSRLEELLPLEAHRQAADQVAAGLRKKFRKVRRRHRIAHRRWRHALATAGLSTDLKPSGLRDVAAAGREFADRQQRLTNAQSELERRRRELASLAGRIEQIFPSAGLAPHSKQPGEQLSQLRRELAEYEGRHRHRQELRRQLRKVRRKGQAATRRLQRLVRRRRTLLDECHVADMAEFRRRADAIARFAALIEDRDSTGREIAALLAGIAEETTIAGLMADSTADQLNTRLGAAARNVDEVRHKQQELLEQRGRLNEQIHQISHDRRLSVKRFELAQIQERLSSAIARWQTLTVTRRLLLEIKDDYERNRQPETLREASEYLAQLTAGHYRRVWTPLGESTLLVDDAAGQPLPVDVLSRGTREQLFLSLRLGLVGLFARRGVQLPMILDDVLVNFDAQRAGAAVGVLRQFVDRGHQLFVFTCHEHVARLFKQQRFNVRRLPDNNQPGRDVPFDGDGQPQARRARSRRAKGDASADEPDSPPEAGVLVTIVGPSASYEPLIVGNDPVAGGREASGRVSSGSAKPGRRVDPAHQSPKPASRRGASQGVQNVVEEGPIVKPLKSFDPQPAPIIVEDATDDDAAADD